MSKKFYELKKRRFRECESKRRYADKKAAVSQINAHKPNRGRHSRPEYLHAYHCTFCNGWHLSKGE